MAKDEQQAVTKDPSPEVKAALRAHYKSIGKKGGLKTKERMKGSAYYSMIGKRGANRRWRRERTTE